jgi:hypothetical protein
MQHGHQKALCASSRQVSFSRGDPTCAGSASCIRTPRSARQPPDRRRTLDVRHDGSARPATKVLMKPMLAASAAEEHTPRPPSRSTPWTTMETGHNLLTRCSVCEQERLDGGSVLH